MKEVKNKHSNKIIKIINTTLSFAFIIIASIVIFEKFDGDEITLTDSEKFANIYQKVPKENKYVYATSEEIIKILESGTGVIYLGYPECTWCQYYTPILNEAATKENIKKIYYFNIKDDREKNTSNYQKIVNLLKNNLFYDDENKHRIYAPDITIVKNGVIIGHDNESALITKDDGTPEQYWTQERKMNLENRLRKFMKELN